MTKMFQRFHLEPFEETNITQPDIALLYYCNNYFFFYPLSFPRKMLLFTKMEMQGKTLHKLGFRVKKIFCRGEFDNILKDSV